MYGATKEQTWRFMKHIVDTNGNPRSSVAKECNLEGFFCELCMRNLGREKLVDAALKYLIVCNIKAAQETKDRGGTWFTDLGDYNGNRWAIAIAYMDWDGTDDWELYGKVAYQPSNSIMQCDYDIDWTMPMFDDSDVDDTEIVIGNPSSSADYLLQEWARIKKTYIEGVK